ncbi:hypothetical protein BD309DRAFT_857684 [Dichomitus squalens]|uniref:BTB domain-containing protein n=1 Tax=Dichomitus squalens TaxID=114155 RepID=A0A4Q9N005_9APHY|nr:hypothetical protein BD311DRAFT_653148 [Dichomitus squalens]TBU46622.1 hypothetical protein BD309DRAFT_857684 [Dichomitus squalens]TBU58416.1 hypothetical protein BD310DRAFT_1015461 [Dichomitus squalens]
MAGMSSQNALMEDTTTRQWNFHAFEWVVRDVSRLRDYIENPPLTAEGENGPEELDEEFDVLRESPELGDGKFKLEISKTTMNEPENPATPSIRTQPPTLSLYITSLTVDFAHTEYEHSASMFAAIKCQDDRIGERGARAEWAWEFWQSNWAFRQGSEVWECPLPPLSVLLENPTIRETDSFVICVQMHSPVGPFYPQQPSAYYVPRDLLEGLEASLDNPNTGDVQFVCLERTSQDQDSLSSSMASLAPASPRSASSSQSPSPPHALARKRIIYAHSDILIRRSEYFATMLSSSFNENSSTLLPGERKVYTIVVEEADFVTIYWLLKWVYANWVLFRKDDDPRQAVDGIGAGWSARDFCSPGVADEWGWKVFHKGGSSDGHSRAVSDARSVTSGASGRSTGDAPREKPKELRVTGSSTTSGMRAGGPSSSKSTAARSPTTPRRPSHGPSGGNTPTMPVPMPNPTSPSGPSSRAPKVVPVPLSPSAPHYSHKQRARSTASTVDPHPHPTPAPQPASALSMYQVAHRYGMPGLGTLALEHIVSTITPQSSFAVLLASTTWDELHSLVEDYIVDKWDEVSVSDEFERCCQEVANGEWGPEGGKTLMALFRRLRSPSVMGYNRN